MNVRTRSSQGFCRSVHAQTWKVHEFCHSICVRSWLSSRICSLNFTFLKRILQKSLSLWFLVNNTAILHHYLSSPVIEIFNAWPLSPLANVTVIQIWWFCAQNTKNVRHFTFLARLSDLPKLVTISFQDQKIKRILPLCDTLESSTCSIEENMRWCSSSVACLSA